MRKFTIISDYEWGESDVVKTLYMNDVEVLTGDWYHNKIDHQIEGFFRCLDILGVEYEVENKTINLNEN